MPLLQRLYDLYSFNVIPLLGQVVAGDRASYRYLVESIRRHPDQAALMTMMEEAGFEMAGYHNLSGGIAAVHRGYKL
jgi:demethylmenaquinone methyltransferase / 2-methoxy-6-polyprenyl-1,4-benzoquinol methylase